MATHLLSRPALAALAAVVALAACGSSGGGGTTDPGTDATADTGVDPGAADGVTDPGGTPDVPGTDPGTPADVPGDDVPPADTPFPVDVPDEIIIPPEVHPVEDLPQSEFDYASLDVGDVCQPECPADGARCTADGRLQPCVTDASGCSAWGEPAACEGGTVCTGGACVPACQPDDTRCLDASTLQVCDGGQVSQQTCALGCDTVARACYACAADAWRCQDAGGTFQLQRCAGGSAWSTVRFCAACACVAGPPVTMECTGQSPMPTTCAACGAGGSDCAP